MRHRQLLFLVLMAIGSSSLPAVGQKEKGDLEKYFKKWLEQDVAYIVTPEETSVFKALKTTEEKESFIEQFWQRRNPDPNNSYNEFKEEHYRRMRYANDHYGSGIPGWKTDRGMTYVKFGPPDRIEAHPSGGHYNRMSWEGGGSTSTYPFERWEYRYLGGVGQDIELEFVDDSLSGEYRLTMNPDDKDAMLRVPGAGMTDAEMMGLSSRADRIVKMTNPMPGHNPLIVGYGRAKDQPFEKLQLLSKIQRAPEIQFKDLRAVVTTAIKYASLPIKVQSHSFRVQENQYMVAATVAVPNKSLQYKGLGDVFRAAVQIYGRVTSLSGQVMQEFEDEVASDLTKNDFQRTIQQTSIYQKTFLVPPGRYKLNVVVKDAVSTEIGMNEAVLVVPKIPGGRLALSSLMLADRIEPQTENSVREQFVLGAVKVYPNIRGEFSRDRDLLLYFQVYNLGVDQATSRPYGEILYKVLSGDREVLRLTQYIGKQEAPDGTVSIAQSIPISELQPGSYRVRVEVQDYIQNQAASGEESFRLPDQQVPPNSRPPR